MRSMAADSETRMYLETIEIKKLKSDVPLDQFGKNIWKHWDKPDSRKWNLQTNKKFIRQYMFCQLYYRMVFCQLSASALLVFHEYDGRSINPANVFWKWVITNRYYSSSPQRETYFRETFVEISDIADRSRTLPATILSWWRVNLWKKGC